MRQRIYLYIGDELVDIDDTSFILLNFSREEMTNPTAYLNSWSQTITLPNTENNNAILGHYFRLDRRTVGSGGTGVNFSALKRTPFRLYDDTGVILMRGYIKLESAEEKGFTISLFGGLGKFFFDLTYTSGGSKLTMADCKYQYTGTYYAANAIYIRCTRSAVLNAWGGLRYGAPSSGQVYDIINFAPCLNGTTYPFKFDTNKAAYRKGSGTNIYPNITPVQYTDPGTGLDYEPYNSDNTVILEFGQKHNEWEVQDLRSYCQRPIFSLRKMIEGIMKYATDAGYTLTIDPDWWNDDNIYLKGVWMTLPFVDRDNLSGGDLNMMTVADFLKGTKTPAEYLIAIAKTFGFVFETSPDGQTIQMRMRQSFYWDKTLDLTDRIDVNSIKVRPYDIDARFYDWQVDMVGMFCDNYERTYGRKYGSLRLDTGYDFDNNVKQVTSLPWKGCADVEDTNVNYQVIVANADPDYGTAINYLCKFAFYDSVKWNLYHADQGGEGDEVRSFEPQPMVNYGGQFYNTSAGRQGAMWLPLPQLHDADGKAFAEEGVLLFYEGMSDTPKVTAGGYTITSVDFVLSDDDSQMLAANGGVPCWQISLPGSGANVTAITWIPSFRRWHFNAGVMQMSLDWGDPIIRPYTGDTFVSNKGLYPNYWEDYMADRLNQDTEVMTCKVDLSGMQVSDELFRNFFYYGGARWVLNKVNNHSVTTLDLTECEFVKIQSTNAYTSGQLDF